MHADCTTIWACFSMQSTVIIAGCRGHGHQDEIFLGPGSARAGWRCGDSHIWVIRHHEFCGVVCFLIWELFLKLDFRMRYAYVFFQILCWVNERAYPFESRTWRRNPPWKNSVINFLCSYLMLMSLHFWVFPSLMVHFNLCSFNTILYKSQWKDPGSRTSGSSGLQIHNNQSKIDLTISLQKIVQATGK